MCWKMFFGKNLKPAAFLYLTSICQIGKVFVAWVFGVYNASLRLKVDAKPQIMRFKWFFSPQTAINWIEKDIKPLLVFKILLFVWIWIMYYQSLRMYQWGLLRWYYLSFIRFHAISSVYYRLIPKAVSVHTTQSITLRQPAIFICNILFWTTIRRWGRQRYIDSLPSLRNHVLPRCVCFG